MLMRKVEQIEEQIRALSAGEFSELRDWVLERDWQAGDARVVGEGGIKRVSTKLTATNPYLRDRDVRERMVIRSVETSSAIEGIRTASKRRAKASDSRVRSNQKKP
jgi:hypothetical protein